MMSDNSQTVVSLESDKINYECNQFRIHNQQASYHSLLWKQFAFKIFVIKFFFEVSFGFLCKIYHIENIESWQKLLQCVSYREGGVSFQPYSRT